MSLASFPESEHLLVLQNGIQAENSLYKFLQGYWDHRLPEAEANAFFLSAGERPPSFPVKPSSLQTRAGLCVFI